jgi:hypothetical protein
MTLADYNAFFPEDPQADGGVIPLALWWIVISGITRTIFYTSFKWANAAYKLLVSALMVNMSSWRLLSSGEWMPGAGKKSRLRCCLALSQPTWGMPNIR